MRQVLGKEYNVFSSDSFINLKIQRIKAGLSTRDMDTDDVSYIALMPQLIKADLVPMNMADVMRARLESVKCNKPRQKKFWLNNSFNTIDGVAYYKGKVKIVHDAQALREVDRYTELRDGALILTPKQYRALEGEELSRSDLKKIGININKWLTKSGVNLYKWLTKSEVKSNPIWQALARDNNLLSEYADLVFAEVKQRYNAEEMQVCNDNYAMRICLYLGSEQENPMMRDWFVDSLDDRSDVGGNSPLYHSARLVGVRAEGASQKETLDEKVIN